MPPRVNTKRNQGDQNIRKFYPTRKAVAEESFGDSSIDLSTKENMAAKHDKANSAQTAAGESDTNTQILAAIKALENKIDSKSKEIMDKLNEKIDSVQKGLSEKIGGITSQLTDIETSLEFAHKEISDLKQVTDKAGEEAKKLQVEVDNTQKETKGVVKEVECVKDVVFEKLNDLERYTRNYSIRVHNVPNLPKQASPEVYVNIVAQILVDNELVDAAYAHDVEPELETAHPVGRGGNQLIAKFYSRPFRNRVLREAKQTLPRGKDVIRINEDMTKYDYMRRKKALPLMQKLYDEGKRVSFRNGRLFVNGKDVPFE